MRGVGEGHISSLIFQTGVWHADGALSLDPRGALATGPTTVLPDPDGPRRTVELTFPDVPIGDRVIFYPFLPGQGRAIEDARFCRFVEDDGEVDYRCTFTAFDGSDHRQSALRTRDFRSFTGRRLDGDAAFRKGAAWFPRRIGGRYLMLPARRRVRLADVVGRCRRLACRRDDHLPPLSLEIHPECNCGSPIEIDEGWLVLTHGVGWARR